MSQLGPFQGGFHGAPQVTPAQFELDLSHDDDLFQRIRASQPFELHLILEKPERKEPFRVIPKRYFGNKIQGEVIAPEPL